MRKLLFTLFVAVFSSNSYAYYQSQQGRWMSRDPMTEKGGLNLYAHTQNDPLNYYDPYGLDRIGPIDLTVCCGGQKIDLKSQGCCTDTPYQKQSQCCENSQIVDKVKIIVYKGRLGGDESSLPIFGPLGHSYAGDPDDPTELYGKHPRPFGQSGCALWGPGYINKEVKRDPNKSQKKEKLVCPEEKMRMLQEGSSQTPYFMGGKNCHSWANGRSK